MDEERPVLTAERINAIRRPFLAICRGRDHGVRGGDPAPSLVPSPPQFNIRRSAMKTSLVLASILFVVATTWAAETEPDVPTTPKPRPRLTLNADGVVTRMDTDVPRPNVSGVVTLETVEVAVPQAAQPLRPEERLPRRNAYYVRPGEFTVLHGGPLAVRNRKGIRFESGIMAHVDTESSAPDGTWDFLRVSW